MYAKFAILQKIFTISLYYRFLFQPKYKRWMKLGVFPSKMIKTGMGAMHFLV